MRVRNSVIARSSPNSRKCTRGRISHPADEGLVLTALQRQLRTTALIVDEFIDSVLHSRPTDLYDATAHYIKNGGKRLRPFLLIKSCELLGGMIEQALPIAAAIEMVHNFTLIHDDIIDNDDFRHNVPTVHRQYGLPLAILGGDTLIIKAFQCITTDGARLGLSGDVIVELMATLTQSCLDMSEGEALDMDMASNGKFFSESQYIEMIAKKTAGLFQTSCQLGALSAQSGKDDVCNLGYYGKNLGIAFQLIDDLIGVAGNPTVTKKPAGNDLREGKKTLPILLAMRKTKGHDREKLLRVFGRKNSSDSELQEALSVLTGTGVDREVRNRARLYAMKALHSINAYGDSESKKALQSVADFVVERTF